MLSTLPGCDSLTGKIKVEQILTCALYPQELNSSVHQIFPYLFVVKSSMLSLPYAFLE